MASHIVTVTEFKAKCLSLLSEVSTSGGTITVTRRGQPLAVVSPPKQRRVRSTEGAWKGKVEISDEEIRTVRSALWNAARTKEKLGI